MVEFPDPWPLRHLVLRTPRLELRPDDDAGLRELAEETQRGVHPPQEMPFALPWTDEPWEDLGINTMRHYWEVRSQHRPDNWRINFLTRVDGRVIGTQSLAARNLAVLREVSTGSWIGLRHQGNGYGTEMRAAVLMFAFDHLGATIARSGAFADNRRSLGVSHSLGYQDNGTTAVNRRGERAEETHLILSADRFTNFRPHWTLKVDGLDQARETLGLPGEGRGPGAMPMTSHPD